MTKKLSKDDLRILHRIQAKKNFNHPIYRVDILEYARIKYANKIGGLCTAIAASAKILCGINIHPSFIAPKFNKYYAARYGKDEFRRNLAYWWPISVWKENGRLGFLKWLIEQYRDDKTIMPRTIDELISLLSC